MLPLLGLGLVAVALTLQGCGGGGGTPSPTPGPPSPSPTPGPPSPGPRPDKPTGYSYKNSTLALGPGISASGAGVSGTLSYELDVFIVNGTVLKKLYMEHKDAFMPDRATSIEALLPRSGHAILETLAGPAMNLMVSSLRGSRSSDFLGLAFSSDSLVQKLRGKGKIQFTSTSRIPMTYYPCISVLEIDSSLNARLMGLYIPDVLTCRRFGTQKEEEHTSSLMIV